MKPSPTYDSEPDLYSFQRCSPSLADCKAVVVESSSDEMSEKQSQDDASTHSSTSDSTLGPMPVTSCSSDVHKQLDAISGGKNGIDLNTIPSMPFHIVTDDQAFVDTNEIPEFPASDWEVNLAPATVEPMPMPMAPTLLPVTPDHQISSSSSLVSCDEMAVFEGRSFQCLDETTLKSMEAVLIVL